MTFWPFTTNILLVEVHCKGGSKMEGLHPKIDDQLKMRLDGFCKIGASLLSRINRIVNELGTEDVTGGTVKEHRLVFHHDRSVCMIVSKNYLYGSRYLSVTIDGEKVLFVNERDDWDYNTASAEDQARLVLIQDQYYKIAAYIPGEWEKWLDFDEIKASLEETGNVNVGEELAHLEAGNERQFYSDLDREIARSFGIPL